MLLVLTKIKAYNTALEYNMCMQDFENLLNALGIDIFYKD